LPILHHFPGWNMSVLGHEGKVWYVEVL